MRNYIIGVLMAVILLLGSVIYKQKNTMVCHHFPIPESLKKKSDDVPFYLFLFFSKNDCPGCLVEIVGVLNALPSHFCVAGIVPADELEDEAELRRLIGVTTLFPLFSYRDYKKYLPWYTPTLFGVSHFGKIVFVYAGVPGQIDYWDLGKSITSIYGRLYPSFKKKHFP